MEGVSHGKQDWKTNVVGSEKRPREGARTPADAGVELIRELFDGNALEVLSRLTRMARGSLNGDRDGTTEQDDATGEPAQPPRRLPRSKVNGNGG